MEIRTYKNNHRSETVKIPLDKIILTEPIHKKGVLGTNISKEDPIIIVRPMGEFEDKYGLVLGWADYQRAKSANLDSIDCILTGMTRHKYLETIRKLDEDGIPKLENITMIAIPSKLLRSRPSELKVKFSMWFYQTYKCFDTPIIIDSNNTLVDGYAKYIAATRLGLDEIQVEYIKEGKW